MKVTKDDFGGCLVLYICVQPTYFFTSGAVVVVAVLRYSLQSGSVMRFLAIFSLTEPIWAPDKQVKFFFFSQKFVFAK